MGDQSSAYEWRRKRDRVDKTIENVENAAQTLLAPRGREAEVRPGRGDRLARLSGGRFS
jgi:hypothetical protein